MCLSLFWELPIIVVIKAKFLLPMYVGMEGGKQIKIRVFNILSDVLGWREIRL